MNGTIEKVFQNKKKVHVLYWIVWLFTFTLTYGSLHGDYISSFFTEMIQLPFRLLFVYGVIEFLVPNFLNKKKLSLFFLLFGVVIICMTIMTRFMFVYVITELPFFVKSQPSHDFDFHALVNSAMKLAFALLLPLIFEFFEKWYNLQKETQALHEDKIEAEFSFLKSQLHPHFLFNTLNSLYSLIITKDNRAEDLVLKLSSLLRYMLYEATSKTILFSQELEYIKDYIDLEKNRYGDRCKVVLDVNANEKEHIISPLLMLSFLENSFKHGLNGHSENGWIHIKINIDENDWLDFKVENSISTLMQEHKKTLGNGIGLKNVKRRLDILYKDNYQLNINSNNTYRVHMRLNLKAIKSDKILKEKELSWG